MIKYFTIEDLLKHYLQKKFHILRNAGFDQLEANIMDINYTSGRKLNKELIKSAPFLLTLKPLTIF